MAIFSLSDVIITVTLLVNALALLSSKTYKEQTNPNSDDEHLETSGLVSNTEKKTTEGTSLNRFQQFMNWIRRLSCIIVVWNIFFTLCMLFVFRS